MAVEALFGNEGGGDVQSSSEQGEHPKTLVNKGTSGGGHASSEQRASTRHPNKGRASVILTCSMLAIFPPSFPDQISTLALIPPSKQ